ncbi:hypothetical protein BP00DRAFT_442534 [Aspergillus indologenus CBS 114.80]|uniref:Uncharacterized protein n=1 Tax=Aspergillus indologenus CBS 114.80 TaxID=1450541 RepID=A0A2V5JAX5_9EURO|nr:hypothetical protein BP00DRAFT_442534 [Aspergillus indologenus CBS 114.80]
MADGSGSGSGSGLGAGSTDPAPQSSSNMPSQRAPATENVDASPAAMEGTLGDAGLLSDTWNHGDRWA